MSYSIIQSLAWDPILGPILSSSLKDPIGSIIVAKTVHEKL